SVTSPRTVLAAFSVIPERTIGRNPSFSTRTSYGPTGRLAAVYPPASLLCDSDTSLVLTLVTITRALGTTAPVESATVPVIVPRSDCPTRAVATQASSKIQRALNMCFPLDQSDLPH